MLVGLETLEDETEHLSRFQRFENLYFSKSKLWTYIGFAIILLGLVLMTTRDLNELTLINLLLTGVGPNSLSGLLGSTSTTSYQQSITTETIINHSTEQVLLLAMSLFKLAIGGFIFFIVQNLTAARKRIMREAEASGVSLGPPPKTPLFAKLFPIMLVLGTDIQFINVGVFMTIWDLNALNILHMQFAGAATGASFQSAVLIEKLIGSLVVPMEMAGATLMLTAIPLGLAAIVLNLRMQGKMFPTLISKMLVQKPCSPPATMALGGSGSHAVAIAHEATPAGMAPRRTVRFTLLGFVFGLSGLILFAPIRALNIVSIVSASFSQTVNTAELATAMLYDGIYAITVEQFLFVGLGIVVLAINLFLLQIVKALRSQRQLFGDTLHSVTGAEISPVESPPWTIRAALVFASIGFGLFLLNFVFALIADNARLASDPFTDGAFSILVRNVKLSAFGFSLIGVGFSLITIMTNLQLTARTLPNFFAKLSNTLQTGKHSTEKIELPEGMSLAPWKLFYPILAGGIILILVTFPLALIEVQSFLTWKTLALSGDTASASYASALLTDRLLEHSLMPIKLFGLGVMLFGIGRTFSVILGYVKARRALLGEGVESLLALAKRT